MSIGRDTDNASIEMQNVTLEVYKQEITDAGTRTGLSRCPLRHSYSRPVRRMKGKKGQKEKELNKPLEAFQKCNFRAGGSARGRRAPSVTV